MWWRNALHHSHEALCVQKLRTVSDPAGTVGAEREKQTKLRNRRRRATKAQKRIPEMVAEQEKIKVGHAAF